MGAGLLHKPTGTNTPTTDHHPMVLLQPLPLLLPMLLQGDTSAATAVTFHAAAAAAAAAGRGVLRHYPTWLDNLLLLMLPKAAWQLARLRARHPPQLLLLLLVLCHRAFLHPAGHSCNTHAADAPAAAALMHQNPTAML